ncbi:MAG: V-type ATP synthase subunit F [Candidatus Hydrothermarchaeaceae archaeon]
MRISFIGDKDTAIGFQLAGVKDARAVESPEEARAALRDLAKDRDTGLIMITERLADKLRDDITAITEGKVTPIVVEIPDKGGPIEKKIDPIKELVKRAVGVEIKFG